MADDQMMTYFVVGSVVLSFLTIAVIFVVRIKKMVALAKDAKITGDGGEGIFEGGNSGEGVAEGVAYEYNYNPGSQKKPSIFTVSILVNTPCALAVSRETGVDRFFKNRGFAVEVQTGDRPFDNDYYIDCDVPKYASRLLTDTHRRRAIQDIFESGYNHLQFDGTKLIARVRPANKLEVSDKGKLQKVVDALAIISKNMPLMPEGMIEEAKKERTRAKYLVFVPVAFSIIGAIASLIAGFSLYEPLDPGTIFLDTLPYSIATFILFSFFAFSTLKGGSGGGPGIIIAILLTFIHIPLSGWGGMMVANGYLDTNPATAHSAKVLNKRISRSDDSTSYYVSMKSWRPGVRHEEIKVGWSFYSDIKPGKDYINIKTRPGRFGYEWIVGYYREKGRALPNDD